MQKLIELTLALVFLGISQILRVRLLNVLVSPHFSIGLRSGIFMNSICSFLNITTPFRLGEAYRYLFLRKRYNAEIAIALIAITIERFLDASILLIILYFSFGSKFYEIAWLHLTFLLLILTIALAVRSLKFFSSTSKKLLLWNKQMSHLGKQAKQNIFQLIIAIWFFYLLSGLFATNIFSTDYRNWLTWNVSSFRLFDYTNNRFQLTQTFNIIFIFSFLFLGIGASLFGHRSNKIIDLLTDSKTDSFRGNSFNKLSDNRISRRIFLEAPIETYLRQVRKSGNVKELYKGGSGALIYSLRSHESTIRKVGFSHQRHRVQEQYEYIIRHSENWSFPKVRNPTFASTYFSYDMEIISPSISMFEMISLIEDDRKIEEVTKRIFSYIQEANKTTSSLELGDNKRILDLFWNRKLTEIVNQVELRVPELFVDSKIEINGILYKDLNTVFADIKKIALKYSGILDISNPHGDPTLSNILLQTDNMTIRGLDPNPNQIIKNSSIDHGKVLQSLIGKYEDTIEKAEFTEFGQGYINYGTIDNRPIEKSKDIYLQLLSENPDLQLMSEFMCFSSMLRLLPYRLDQDAKTAPIFIAKTVEIGSSILKKYR